MTDIVLVDKRKEVWVVTMNRPKLGNAMSMEMYPLLTRALRDAAADKAVKAVVLTGAGQFFSTGADVAQAAQKMIEGSGDVSELTATLRSGPITLTQTIIDFPKLLVAAVNGPVVGFPAGLLGLCDLVFVSETATYSTPFMHLGLVPEGASSHTIPRIVGSALAMDLLLTNRKLSAAEMVSSGLASRVLPAGDAFVPKALEIVEKGAAASAAGSLVEAKRLIRGLNAEKLRADYKVEADALVARFEGGEPMKRFAKLFMKMGERKQSKL